MLDVADDSSNRVTLRSDVSPKQINIFGEGLLIQGIYECKGDTLEIAYWGKPEIGRPSSIEANPESYRTHTLWIFKRSSTTKAMIGNDAARASPSEMPADQ